MSKSKPATPDTSSARLAALLKKSGTMELAIETLHKNLSAVKSHYDSASGSWISEPDGATQIRAVELALNFAVGSPVKRQQIMSGRIPAAPPDREQLQDAVLRRIAAKLEQPDLSASELLSLKKALVEAEADSPLAPLTEDQLVAAAKRIHGMAEPDNSPAPVYMSPENNEAP